ncbi:hypothetical protein D7I43_29220 [Micromonospora globbae]|uniref:Uncharacterized protein n=1 Tax=Micromonospora globbae TaxID=1894969 RepID=A0A420ET52_9ACTN|nr:hypothetical protein D7I43_29220 [Micromonospora globbae]
MVRSGRLPAMTNVNGQADLVAIAIALRDVAEEVDGGERLARNLAAALQRADVDPTVWSSAQSQAQGWRDQIRWIRR